MADTDRLTDEELLAVANNPQLVAKMTDEEKTRLGRLKAGRPQAPTGQEASGAVKRFVSNAASAVLPSTTPSDYVAGPLYAAQHPIESVKLVGGAVIDAHKAAATKAMEKGKAALHGDALAIPEAIGYGAAAALPIVGPAAAGAGEQIASGDVAGGLGTAAGLLTPSAMEAARSSGGPLVASMKERLAAKADQMSTKRLSDVMAPNVGPNKVRFGNDAAAVAPQLAREPGLGAMTREGLQTKVETRLAESEQALDAAANARNAKKVYATGPIIADLKAQVGRRTAKTARVQNVKAGADIVPGPSQARVAVINQAIAEIEQLGPYATYEALRRVRESYDGPAKAIYSPSMTADYLSKKGEKLGAADITGVLRDKLGTFDPATAKANADYSLYKSASDVLSATEEVQRTRPTTGRKMLTAAIGGGLGETIQPGVGMAVGIALGPIVDEALNAGMTTKITTARLLAQYADALRSHQPKRATTIALQLKRIGGKSSVAAGRMQQGVRPGVERAPQVAQQEDPQRQGAR